MFKKVALVLTFIISLVVSLGGIITITTHSTGCPEFESDSYCTGYYLGQNVYIIPAIFICIASGYFLFRRKKEQINSDSQNITDEDQNGITNSQNNDDSIESKLEKLKSMLDKELITEEEFNAKKQKLIEEI